MRDDENGQDRTKFLMIAVAIAIAMFAIYMLAFQRNPVSLPETPLERPVEQTIQEPATEDDSEYNGPDQNIEKEESAGPAEGFDHSSLSATPDMTESEPPEHNEPGVKGPAYEAPQWIKNSSPVNVPATGHKVAIIIDDMGENKYWTQQAMALPATVTLAFLPYPDGVKGLVETARDDGHEIMVHMPMEPTKKGLDTGSYVLRSEMSEETLMEIMQENMAAFEGYVGINNHMGSALTQDKQAMTTIMQHLREKGLLFLDSRTISSSVAGELARANHIPTVDRDVFIDHVPTEAAVAAALAKIEAVSMEYGSVIAIGHPKKVTIEALQDWIPTLAEKNIYLVPITALVKPDLSSLQVRNEQNREALADVIN